MSSRASTPVPRLRPLYMARPLYRRAPPHFYLILRAFHRHARAYVIEAIPRARVNILECPHLLPLS